MSPKTLRWWLEKWHTACALACLYKIELSVVQFCACHGMEEIERDQIIAFFAAHGEGV